VDEDAAMIIVMKASKLHVVVKEEGAEEVGGRGQAPAPQADDSGNESDLERHAQQNHAANVDFQVDEEDDDEEPDIPAQPPDLFTALPRELLGGMGNRINRPFGQGLFAGALNLDRFRNWSPRKILLHFATPLFQVIRECSNTVPGANFTMRDMYAYHALLCMTTLVPMNRLEDFWDPLPCMSRREEM